MEKQYPRNKKITIDSLALMIGKGFASMDKRFAGVDKRLDGVDKKLAEIKEEIKDINVEVNRRVHIFDHKSLELRVERLEEKTGITRTK